MEYKSHYLDFTDITDPNDVDTMYMDPIYRDDITKKYEKHMLFEQEQQDMKIITCMNKNFRDIDLPIDVEAFAREREEAAKTYTYVTTSTNTLVPRIVCPRCGHELCSEFTTEPLAMSIVVNYGSIHAGTVYPLRECQSCMLKWHDVRLPANGSKVPVKRKDGSYFFDNVDTDPKKWVSKIIYDCIFPFVPEPEPEKAPKRPRWCVIS